MLILTKRRILLKSQANRKPDSLLHYKLSLNSLYLYMEFSTNLFWDADASQFDYEKHAEQIIPRVFMRGKLNDILEVLRYYGKNKVRDVLLQTRYLDKVTLSFVANYFKIEIEEFRCYKLSQSIPQHWPY